MPSVSDFQKILHQATFQTSVPSVHKLTEDHGREVAFVGRSNSGKSSTLNRLTQSKIARTREKTDNAALGSNNCKPAAPAAG